MSSKILYALYTCDENYAPYAGISMNSLFENNRELEHICVYLVEDSVSEENKKRFIDQAEKYGREIIPYLNNSIISFSFDIREKNCFFVCIDYVIYALREFNLLTESELQLYQMIFASKLETYVAKHKIIDEIVIDNFGYLTYDTFIKDENTIFPPSITPENLKEYYEAKLGITVEIAEELK